MASGTLTVTPAFLFSLPRSGSTLLQRLLATHPELHTTSEPWLLLPLLFTLKDHGARTIYGHEWLRIAIDDLVDELPRGRADYLEALAGCARALYTRASPPGTRYFLDKTPRYHLVVDEIAEAFPDAPMIFLWRHPLAVAASVMQTFARPSGHWNLFRARIDLYDGLDALVQAFGRHRDRAVAVRYEDLVGTPEPTLAGLFAHLDLAPPADGVARLAEIRLPGRLGDRLGTARYPSLTTASCDTWSQMLGNPLRRSWARRYVDWIGAGRLGAMGYDLSEIHSQIDAMPGSYSYLASDCLRTIYGHLHDLIVHHGPGVGHLDPER